MHSRSKTNFPELFTRSGKTGEIQIPRCQGFAIQDYGFTLGALTLNTSGFCNVRVLSVKVGVDLSYIIYRARSESVKRRLQPFTEHLGRWLKFLWGRRRIHWGVPHPTAPVSKAQKRQSLKEALPMWSDSGSNMFRRLRSVQLGIVSVAFGNEALPLSQTLQVAYLLMFATQLLM